MAKRLAWVSIVWLVGCVAAFAQATGTINGRVIDTGDAGLPGVTINIKNVETGATRTTITNERGLYTIPALERGTYELSTELAGFAVATHKVELITGSTISADFRLGI